MRKLEDLTGFRSGRITVTRLASSSSPRLWEFVCDCGNVKSARISDIKRGMVKSCGCLAKENLISRNKANAKYGEIFNLPTGMSWRGMMARCYNPKQNSYPYYGAIGITVCEFLRSTPQNIVLIIGPRPSKRTLDRKNNRDGYHCGQCKECLENNWPLNIRWATKNVQARNKSSNRLFTINGETRCVTEWAEIHRIKRDTIWDRVKHGKTGLDLIAPPK